MPPRILTCARIHRQNTSLQPIDLTRLAFLLRAAPSYSQGLAVATDGDDAVLVRAIEELIHAYASPPGFLVTVISVRPYGRFVAPLNAMVARAAGEGFDRVLFQSLEVVIREGEVEKMAEQMDEDTLVVGKAFNSHAFVPGENELTGLTTPWNTFAMWNVRKIALDSFSLPTASILMSCLPRRKPPPSLCISFFAPQPPRPCSSVLLSPARETDGKRNGLLPLSFDSLVSTRTRLHQKAHAPPPIGPTPSATSGMLTRWPPKSRASTASYYAWGLPDVGELCTWIRHRRPRRPIRNLILGKT
ncbi:hypothetical protein BC937DRAFT_92294 [Endogone sp. FLAS-F59071]|nr:hypothetical protein BC937DRAFT_92294 [Endogone sp. FLAS-F59071]|eukprot:RUS15566.1 hypothetical protein BC937DRAFT_92294 [Endogone sp. FLAS-F59071]